MASTRWATWSVRSSTRAAWATSMPDQPAGRRDQRLLDQRGGSQPPSARPSHSATRRRHRISGGLAQRAVGRHRAPGEPAAALEEVGERAGVVGGAGVDRQRQDLRAGLQDHRPVGPAAAVQAGDGPLLDGGQRGGHQVERVVDAEREAGVERGGEPGLVEEHQRRGAGRGPPGGLQHRRRRGRSTACPPRRRPGRAGHADGVEGKAQRHRAGELELERRHPAGDRLEEGPQADERLALDARRPAGARGRPRPRRPGATRRAAPARPAIPHAACGIMPSTGETGGAATARPAAAAGVSSTNATASAASSCGRLPIADASPIGRRTSLMAPPPAVPRCLSKEPPLDRMPSEIATGRRHRQISGPWTPAPPPPPRLRQARAWAAAGGTCPLAVAGARRVAGAAPGGGAGARRRAERRHRPYGGGERRCRGRAGRACSLPTLVPTTVSLTALRVAAPAAVAATAAAVVAGPGRPPASWQWRPARWRRWSSLAPETAEVFVDGSSYGDERRLPLRTPAPLLAGPVELAWRRRWWRRAVGALLLAAGQWAAGALALAAGVPLAVRAPGHSTRWPGGGWCSCPPAWSCTIRSPWPSRSCSGGRTSGPWAAARGATPPPSTSPPAPPGLGPAGADPVRWRRSPWSTRRATDAGAPADAPTTAEAVLVDAGAARGRALAEAPPSRGIRR